MCVRGCLCACVCVVLQCCRASEGCWEVDENTASCFIILLWSCLDGGVVLPWKQQTRAVNMGMCRMGEICPVCVGYVCLCVTVCGSSALNVVSL